MNKFWGWLLLIRASYDAMTPGEQRAALWHLGLDLVIVMFLVSMIFIGLTQMASAFVIWVPALAFAAWVRFKRARRRWSL